MAVMAIILLIGAATLKFVDVQQAQSGRERTRESSFNLAEGLLYAQAATLRANWPTKFCATASTGCSYVDTCDPSITGAAQQLQCPDFSARLAGSQKVFNNVDIDGNSGLGNWKVQVRDDVGGVVGGVQATPDPIYFGPPQGSTSCTAANNCVNFPYDTTDEPCGAHVCTWDANGNHKLWVRVDAVVLNRATNQLQPRSIVALLQLEEINVPFAHNAVVAGSVSISNTGNKTVVSANGSTVVTRCTPTPYDTTTAEWGPTTSNTSASVQVTDGTTWGSVGNGTSISVDDGTQNYEVLKFQSYSSGTKTVTFQAPPGKKHGQAAVMMLQPGPSNPCQSWDEANKTQVSPPSAFVANPTYASGLSAAQLAAVETSADSTWNNQCPSSRAEWTGGVVIKQTPPGGCTLDPPQSGDINTHENPGFVIVENGTLNVKANAIYYGVLYVMNGGPCPPPANATPWLDLSGNPTVIGGVSVDSCGTVVLGSGSGTHASVEYDPVDISPFDAIGAAGLVQNTWRELAPGQ